tara:strand:+ start:11238 stop:11762 length:525 start_codon:yes stop_codon:yes gene_type:complete
MGTFVVSSDNAHIYQEWDHILNSTEKMKNDTRVSNQSDPETYLKYLYKEYYIKKMLFYLENEIVRHEKYLEIGYHPFFFPTDEELQDYIDGNKVSYPVYLKKVQEALGDDYDECYREAKEEWNREVLQRLEESDWSDIPGINFFLPRFYKSGKHVKLKDKDWDYKNTRYRDEDD